MSRSSNNQSRKAVHLPLRVQVDGRTWRLFAYEYETVDGKFQGYLHALSHYHAQMLIAEMKDTAKLSGQITETS